MDADVMITTVFFLEVFVAALVAAVAVAGGVRKANTEAAAENQRDGGQVRADAIFPRPPASANSPNDGDVQA
jgi:hypothetical protein